MKSNHLIFILMNLHFEKNTLRLSLSNSQSQWIKSKTLRHGNEYVSYVLHCKLRSTDFASWKHHQISTSTAMLTLNVLWVFFGFSSVCLLICLFLSFLFLICFLFFYILAIFMYSDNHFRLVRVMNIHV